MPSDAGTRVRLGVDRLPSTIRTITMFAYHPHTLLGSCYTALCLEQFEAAQRQSGRRGELEGELLCQMIDPTVIEKGKARVHPLQGSAGLQVNTLRRGSSSLSSPFISVFPSLIHQRADSWPSIAY